MSPRALSFAFLLSISAWAGCVGPGLGAEVVPEVRALLCPDPCATLVDGPHAYLLEAPIAVHPTDPDHRAIVLHEGRPDWSPYASWLAVAVTRDGGATWTKRVLPGGLFEDPRHPLAGHNSARYPSIVIAPGGEIVVGGWAYGVEATPRTAGVVPGQAVFVPRNALFVAVSPDDGATWPHVSIVLDGRGTFVGQAADGTVVYAGGTQSWLALAPDGSILFTHIDEDQPLTLAGTDFLPYTARVVARHSTDAGRTWSDPETIVDTVHVQPRAAIGPSGGEYVLLHSPSGLPRPRGQLPSPYDLVLAIRAPGAASWTTTPLGLIAGHGRIAVGSADGIERIHVVHPEYVGDPEDLMIRSVLIHSDDGGRTWSAPLVVQEPEFAGHALPTVGVDAQGTAYVTLYHPIDEEGALEHRAYAIRDGVVSAPTVLDHVDAAGRTGDLGHYMSVVGLDEGAAAAWLGGEMERLWTRTNKIVMMTATLEVAP